MLLLCFISISVRQCISRVDVDLWNGMVKLVDEIMKQAPPYIRNLDLQYIPVVIVNSLVISYHNLKILQELQVLKELHKKFEMFWEFHIKSESSEEIRYIKNLKFLKNYIKNLKILTELHKNSNKSFGIAL